MLEVLFTHLAWVKFADNCLLQNEIESSVILYRRTNII